MDKLYVCPKCNMQSNVKLKTKNIYEEYSDIGTCRPSWAKVTYISGECPVCGNEIAVEVCSERLSKQPRGVKIKLCIL